MKKQLFPPPLTPKTQATKRERNCGRREVRALEVIEVTPSQVGFPAARLAGKLRRRIKRNGKWTREVVYLLSSHTLDELEAAGMLQMKRNYWVVESRLHHCLDITMQEDRSRVRTPKAAHVLGMTRRLAVSLSNACVDRARKINPKTKANTKRFRQAYLSKKGGEERLHALLFAKKPTLPDLEN